MKSEQFDEHVQSDAFGLTNQETEEESIEATEDMPMKISARSLELKLDELIGLIRNIRRLLLSFWIVIVALPSILYFAQTCS